MTLGQKQALARLKKVITNQAKRSFFLICIPVYRQ